MSLVTTLTLGLLMDLRKTFSGQELQPRPLITLDDALADGTDLDEANKLYGPKRRTLAGGASETLDLSGTGTGAGTLQDVFGDYVQFTKVKALVIHNTNLVAGNVLEIGGAAANTFMLFDNATDIYQLGPNGIFFVWEPSLAGLAVTAGTADLLKINVPGGTAIDYDIAILGV